MVALFVLVTLFMRDGILGLVVKLKRRAKAENKVELAEKEAA